MTRTVHAIDPGPVKSALVTFNPSGRVRAVTLPNEELLDELVLLVEDDAPLVVEMIASYGMAVGREVFETCVWIGRYIEAWTCRGEYASPVHRMTRIEVKNAICHNPKAKDANVRAALIDLFGGSDAIRKGGPLYKVKGDEWAALAVAVAYTMRQGKEEPHV